MIPSSIKPGDTIGVIAPANIILEKDEEYIEKSTKLFEDFGYKVKFGKYVRANTLGYGATAKQKAEEIIRIIPLLVLEILISKRPD